MKTVVVLISLSVAISCFGDMFYWVGDESPAFLNEANWSTLPDDASSEPSGNPIDSPITGHDLVIAAEYNGTAIANPPGGTPMEYSRNNMSGVSAFGMDGSSLTLDGTSFKMGDNEVAWGPYPHDWTLNIDNGGTFGCEAVRKADVNISDTSELWIYGWGTGIFTETLLNFETTGSRVQLLEYGEIDADGDGDGLLTKDELSGQLGDAVGFQFNGTDITTDELQVSTDGYISAIPEPMTFGLLSLFVGLALLRRRLLR